MAKTYSCILVGMEVHPIEIETVLGSGFSGLNILGLPTDATRDMRERVRQALESIGIPIPARRVVVNVSSNELIKLSRTPLSQLDFAVAASIIRAFFEEDEMNIPLFQPEYEFLAGELSLMAELKPISNPLIYETLAYTKNLKRTICLSYQVKDIQAEFEYYKNLNDWLNDRKIIKQRQNSVLIHQEINLQESEFKIDQKKLEEAQKTIELILKNPKACVALLVAAAGKHSILIAGEPGIGKSFSLKRIPSLLLPLEESEKIEVKLIHSRSDVIEKPFRFPHHSATAAALVGGSSLKPGEVTLAHRGILFLDELAEFPRSSLEALREPMDSGCVTLSRSNGNIIYPAEFQLCATTNPCPCGYRFSRKKPCRCRDSESKKYLQKISGPLLDRFCLQLWLDSSESEEDLDIFSFHLKKCQQKNNLKEFLLHFFKVQKELFHKGESLKLFSGENNFSLRGKEKIAQIAFTFEKLFPSLVDKKEFSETILSYRKLSDLFTRNY